jgi:hypothetical protein
MTVGHVYEFPSDAAILTAAVARDAMADPCRAPARPVNSVLGSYI